MNPNTLKYDNFIANCCGEREKYVITDNRSGMTIQRVLSITKEQADAIDWFIDFIHDDEVCIEKIDDCDVVVL